MDKTYHSDCSDFFRLFSSTISLVLSCSSSHSPLFCSLPDVWWEAVGSDVMDHAHLGSSVHLWGGQRLPLHLLSVSLAIHLFIHLIHSCFVITCDHSPSPWAHCRSCLMLRYVLPYVLPITDLSCRYVLWLVNMSGCVECSLFFSPGIYLSSLDVILSSLSVWCLLLNWMF